jgi:DNA-binding response OmpR family regulator
VRILVVDDDEDIRFLLQDTFSRMGFDVDVASDGPDALRKVSEAPDAVIIDQKLEGASGLDVVADMRSAGYEGKVVLFSGLIDAATAQRAAELDVTPVNKSQVAELGSVVSELLDGPS